MGFLISRFTTVPLRIRRTIASLGLDGLVRLGLPAIICQPFLRAHLVSSSLSMLRSSRPVRGTPCWGVAIFVRRARARQLDGRVEPSHGERLYRLPKLSQARGERQSAATQR